MGSVDDGVIEVVTVDGVVCRSRGVSGDSEEGAGGAVGLGSVQEVVSAVDNLANSMVGFFSILMVMVLDYLHSVREIVAGDDFRAFLGTG